MTDVSTLRAALLEAGERMPPPLVPGDLWARARRERRHRRVRRAVVAVAIAAVAVLGAPLLTGVPPIPAPGSRPDHVTGYPMRIGHQWIVTDLPAAPGPIAAVVETSNHGGSQLTGWAAVSPSGRLWHIPLGDGRTDTYPALSHDGRYLAYLSRRTKSFVIADLVSGRQTRFADVGGSAIIGPDLHPRDLHAFIVQDQTPGYFSPDDRRVLFLGRGNGNSGAVVLDRITGRASLVGIPPLSPATQGGLGTSYGFPIGWSGPDAVWWLSPYYSTTQAIPATLRAVSLDSRTLRTVSLPPLASHGWPVSFNQWTGPVSPDGMELAGTSSDPARPGVWRFWIGPGSGGADNGFSGFEAPLQPCGLGWSAGQVIVPTSDPHTGGGATMLMESLAPRPVSLISPRLGPRCVVWAGDALAGRPTGPHPFGLSTAAWTWWWQEIIAGTAAVLLGVLILVIARIRRVRRA